MREPSLDDLVKQRGIEIGKKRGFFLRICEGIHQWFFEGPVPEIQKDWCAVRDFADKVRVSVDKPEVDEETRHTFATVLAYLDLAKRERDPGQAWNYVNSADVLLPLVVAKEDFNRCLSRLRDWDKMLMELGNVSEKDLDDIGKRYPPEAVPDPMTDEHRNAASCGQAARAQLWSSINGRISLKFSLWCSISLKLLGGLILATILAEILYAGLSPEKPWWFFPFLTVSVMGFFGGGLSAFLIARESVVDTTSCGLIKVWTTSRMLVGAAGAFVTYIVVQWPGLLAGVDISQLLSENVFVLLSIGILAGFSEQLFVESLDKSAQNLRIVGKPKREKREVPL